MQNKMVYEGFINTFRVKMLETGDIYQMLFLCVLVFIN